MVSFTKNAEIIPKPITNTRSIEFRSLPALDIIFTATNLRTPDLSSAETMLNIPKRNIITSRLIALKSIFKAYDLSPIIRAAPISIEVQIGILFNLLLSTMRKNAITNTPIATNSFRCILRFDPRPSSGRSICYSFLSRKTLSFYDLFRLFLWCDSTWNHFTNKLSGILSTT
jgi:hypothetical protein